MNAPKPYLFLHQARSQNCEERLIAPSRLSISPSAWNNSAPTGQISIKFDISVLLENLSRKLKLHYNWTRIKGTLHEKQYTFLIMYRLIILKIRNVSDKSCTENQHTYISCSITLF
jgi:hypothetical protein